MACECDSSVCVPDCAKGVCVTVWFAVTLPSAASQISTFSVSTSMPFRSTSVVAVYHIEVVEEHVQLAHDLRHFTSCSFQGSPSAT